MHSNRLHALPAFGRRIKTLRRARLVKQSALAAAVGVEQSTVSRWESGAQTPDKELQEHVLSVLVVTCPTKDSALRRLVETSKLAMHLIDDASHICLAYSAKRGREWRRDPEALSGKPLWRFATDEIRRAELDMADSGWWDSHAPEPVNLSTSDHTNPEMSIKAGVLTYERLYLSDGTPVRLCTSSY